MTLKHSRESPHLIRGRLAKVPKTRDPQLYVCQAVLARSLRLQCPSGIDRAICEGRQQQAPPGQLRTAHRPKDCPLTEVLTASIAEKQHKISFSNPFTKPLLYLHDISSLSVNHPIFSLDRNVMRQGYIPSKMISSHSVPRSHFPTQVHCSPPFGPEALIFS